MPDNAASVTSQARRERTESARLDNFVDGAFAFAVTLLVISGGNLPHDVAALEYALRGIPAFALCFSQLALFWHGHVRWRDTCRLTDRGSLLLSLLLVFFALIFVFPLYLLYSSFLNGISHGMLSPGFKFDPADLQSLRAMYACYGLSYACMAGTLTWLFRHGLRHAASPDRESRISARVSMAIWAFCAAVGLLSALTIAFPFGNGKMVGVQFSLGGSCYALLALIGLIRRRYRRHLEATLPP